LYPPLLSAQAARVTIAARARYIVLMLVSFHRNIASSGPLA